MRPTRFDSNCCGIDWSCRIGCPCLLEALHRAVQSGKNTTGRERRQLVLWGRMRGGGEKGGDTPRPQKENDAMLGLPRDAAGGGAELVSVGVGDWPGGGGGGARCAR